MNEMYDQNQSGQDNWQNPWDYKGRRKDGKMKRSIIIVVITLCGLLLLGGVGFGAYTLAINSMSADGGQENTQTQWEWGNGNMPDFSGDTSDGQRMPGGVGGMGGMGGMDFSQFVEDGLIDQDTADKMQAYMEEQMQGQRENGQSSDRPDSTDMFSGLFDGMVEEGILTQEQADEIQESMPQPGSGNMPEGFPGGFGSEGGT